MSAAAALTARIMETWAHGRTSPTPWARRGRRTPGLRHVAHIWRAARVPNSFRGERPREPDAPIYVALDRARRRALGVGSARRREPGDRRAAGASAWSQPSAAIPTTRTSSSTGPAATEWLTIAQAFAGPPGAGRAPSRPRRDERRRDAARARPDRATARASTATASRRPRDARRSRSGRRPHAATTSPSSRCSSSARRCSATPSQGYARDVPHARSRTCSATASTAGSGSSPTRAGSTRPGSPRTDALGSRRSGSTPRVAVVEGDDLRDRLDDLVQSGLDFTNLDTGVALAASGLVPVTANAYLGGVGHRRSARGRRRRRGVRAGHRRVGGRRPGGVVARLGARRLRRARRRGDRRARDRVRAAVHRRQLPVPRRAHRPGYPGLPDRRGRRRRLVGDHEARRAPGARSRSGRSPRSCSTRSRSPRTRPRRHRALRHDQPARGRRATGWRSTVRAGARRRTRSRSRSTATAATATR